jgi:hypothetical protein
MPQSTYAVTLMVRPEARFAVATTPIAVQVPAAEG